MKTILISGELVIDENMLYEKDDEESVHWFYNEILLGEGLLVHSNEIGDTIGRLWIRRLGE